MDNVSVLVSIEKYEELIQKVIPRAEHHLTDAQTDILRIGAKRVISLQKY